MIWPCVRTRLRTVVSERTSLIVGLPAEQAGDGDKGQLLRQQTGPFLQAAGDDDAVVRLARTALPGITWVCVWRMGADLAGEREGAEAAGDGDGLMAVSVDA